MQKQIPHKINILLLGSTGSIGTQTLEVIAKLAKQSKHKDKFNIYGLVCNSNEELLRKQLAKLAKIQKSRPKFLIASRHNNLEALIKDPKVDLIINAISGAEGLKPTKLALKHKKPLALANKESIILDGKAIMALAKKNKTQVLPLDSEHHAVLRLLETKGLTRYNSKRVKRITITASGGPFFDTPKSEFKNITPKQALKNPNWSMGPKILIESATLLNKGFEIIEAHHLFGCPLAKLTAIVDRKSYIHAIVEFARTAKTKNNPSQPAQTIALAYKPDMKIVIEDTLLKFYHDEAMSKPNLLQSSKTPLFKRTLPASSPFENRKIKILNHAQLKKRKLQPIPHAKFPAFKLVIKAFKQGKIRQFYKQSEQNIDKFLKGEIKFTEIV